MIIHFYINFVFINYFIILIKSNIIICVLDYSGARFFVCFAPQAISTICVLTAPFAHLRETIQERERVITVRFQPFERDHPRER
jgi:hypothetical protein